MADLINIVGGSELQAVLDDLPRRVSNNIMRGAVVAGANVIRDIARQNAPVLEGSEELKRAGIKHLDQYKPGYLKKQIRAGRKRGSSTQVAAIVHTGGAFYGRFIEFGTLHIAAQPFMRPALDAGAEEAIQAVADYAAARVETEILKL